MQATINYHYGQQTSPALNINAVPAIVRKEARTKTLLFAGMLACLLLAVII